MVFVVLGQDRISMRNLRNHSLSPIQAAPDEDPLGRENPQQRLVLVLAAHAQIPRGYPCRGGHSCIVAEMLRVLEPVGIGLRADQVVELVLLAADMPQKREIDVCVLRAPVFLWPSPIASSSHSKPLSIFSETNVCRRNGPNTASLRVRPGRLGKVTRTLRRGMSVYLTSRRLRVVL